MSYAKKEGKTGTEYQISVASSCGGMELCIFDYLTNA